MKIVNKEDFYKLPTGTLFANYQPIIFEGLFIKGINLYDDEGLPYDFIQESLLGNLDCSGSTEQDEILFKAEKEGLSFKLDFDNSTREGFYDSEDLYAIYEKHDVQQFVSKLSTCLDLLTPPQGDKKYKMDNKITIEEAEVFVSMNIPIAIKSKRTKKLVPVFTSYRAREVLINELAKDICNTFVLKNQSPPTKGKN